MSSIKSGFVMLFFSCCSCTLLSAAGDLSHLYDRATLENWRLRYERSTTKILNEVIWPVLLSDEKFRFLNSKPSLEFPLWADDETVRGNPLAFYVPSSGDRIVFPVFSLKFLDDLCTAYAWLQINGYGLETISEYTAILNYGRPENGKFPPPLKALQIPEDALSDARVDELALGHFVTARTFILLHEMGHIIYGHHKREPQNSEESIKAEQQADRFAVTVMQRTPLPPLGIIVFFLADAHQSGFRPRRDTHPLSGERIRALAVHVDDPTLAENLQKLGKLLDDDDIRAGFVATGKAGDLAALAPRRPGELPGQSHRPSQRASTVSFDGAYQSEFVQFLEPDPIAFEIVLERRDNHVRGRYNFGLGFWTLEGTVEGDHLYFRWEWMSNYGRGVFKHRSDGSFTGTWGYGEAKSGAGTWTGRRVTKSQANSEVQRIKNYLSGQRMLMTYREGGSLYGTYFYRDIHFCQSGQYIVYVKTQKQTVLDNQQFNSWEEYGTWDVVSFQGQVVLRSQSISGEQASIPIRLLPDNRLSIGDGISMEPQGRAECR